MSGAPRVDAGDRKALLVARAQLERMQIALALHEIRERVVPERTERARTGRPATVAAALVGIGLPLFGRKRLGRLLRYASLGMSAWRVARNWRASRG